MVQDATKARMKQRSACPGFYDDNRSSRLPSPAPARRLDDFRRTFSIVRTLPCDLLLSPHPDKSRWTPAATAVPHPQPMSCRDYADGAERDLDAELRKQRKAKR